jgi:CubicO group peptidase (beta-lactamase class C family)
MQRIENKTLEAKDNVGQYLPIFKNTNITIKELLTHTSGLSDSVRPVNAKRSEQSHLSLVQKKPPITNVIRSLHIAIQFLTF